jgi:hypothetical protein
MTVGRRRCTPGSHPDTFGERLRGHGTPGQCGQFVSTDLALDHVADIRLFADATDPEGWRAKFGVPVLCRVAGDGDTPTIGPALTATGATGLVPGPYQDAAGADIDVEVFDGADSFKQTAGSLDPGAGDVVISGFIKTGADVAGLQFLMTHRADAGGRGYRFYISGALLTVQVAGDATITRSANVAANTLYHFTAIINRDGNVSLHINGIFKQLIACCTGDIFAAAALQICAQGASRFNGYLFWLLEWQGVGISDAWEADSYELVKALSRAAMGLDRGSWIELPAPRQMSQATATAWVDHHGTAWSVTTGMPRCGNSLGLQVDVDGPGAYPDCLWVGRRGVGVSGNHTRLLAVRNRTSIPAAVTTQAPARIIPCWGQSNNHGRLTRAGLAMGYQLPRADIPAMVYLGNDGSPDGPYQSVLPEPLNCPGDVAASLLSSEVTMLIDLATAGERACLSKVSYGGPSLAVDWAPGTGAMWSIAVAELQRAMSLTGAVPWLLKFNQGEADSANAIWAAAYEANLTAFIAAVRAVVGNPTLPVLIDRLGNWSAGAFTAQVEAAQDAVEAADVNVHCVNCNGISHMADNLHYDAAGCIALGILEAAEVLSW